MGSRWDWIKYQWQHEKKWDATKLFVTSLPELSYPFGADNYRQKVNQFQFWSFTGDMAGPTWWREVWHFLGGFFITAPFILWPAVCFIVSFFIAVWKAYAEFFEDAQTKPDLKNFVDWLFWIMGSASVTIGAFILFGGYPYK